MAIIKKKEIAKMSSTEKKEKLKDLKMELVKSNVAANRSGSKTKEIKRAISRLLTSMNAEKINKPAAKQGGAGKK